MPPQAPTTNTVDKRYFKDPNESLEQYNTRVKQYYTPTPPVGTPEPQKDLQATPESSQAANESLRASQGTYTGQDGKQYYNSDGSPVGASGTRTSVSSYTDNPDGTTTNNLADGSKDTGTYTKNPDGTYTFNPNGRSPLLGAQGERDKMDSLVANYEAEAKRVQDTITNIQNGSIPLTTGEQAQIDGLKAQFQTLIESQKLTNTGAEGVASIRGYQTGSAEYDPMFQTKVIGQIITAGNNKIADLNIQMASAVAKMTDAFKQNKISAVKDAWDIYDKAATKRQATLEKTINDTQAAIKDAQDRYDKQVEAKIKIQEQAQKDINSVLSDAAKNGAPKDVQQMIANAVTVSEAVGAAGEWLQTASGLPGEYLAYKRDALARGLKPVSFDEYAEIDANRKKTVELGLAGLTPTQANLATKLSDDYEMRSKDFYTTRDAYNRIIASASDPSAAGDLSLIFAYMKMLDPNSVVRETEFATAQNAGSIPERVRAQYNKALQGERLAQTQREDFIDRAEKLFVSAKKQQDSIVQEFTNRATQYGLPTDLIVRSTEATGNSILNSEEQAKERIDSLYTSSPEKAAQIEGIYEMFPDATDSDILKILGEPISFNPVGGDTQTATGNQSMNRPTRNKNPLNIKWSDITMKYPGVAGKDPKPAADGGHFIVFETPEAGFNAAKTLITSKNYKNLSVDQALKRWSNNGYGGEIVPAIKGKTVAMLTPTELDTLIKTMARREGYTA